VDSAPNDPLQGEHAHRERVHCRDRRGRASYEWQFSTDQKTWTNAPTTLQAKIAITGLTSGSVYYFRFRAVTKAGEGAYSQVVQILVL